MIGESGQHFSYYTTGDSHNPPILFLHGFMGDRTEFHAVMLSLASQYYCISIDLPGHGDLLTDRDLSNYTIIDTARALIEFLNAFQIEKCHLVGYSMGGRLALYLALHFPEYFLKIVLESASPGLKTASERSDRWQSDLKLAERLETGDLELFLRQWYEQPIFAALREHPDFEKLLEQRSQNDPVALARSLRHLSVGCQPSLWEKLSENTIPLLLLVGELDLKFVNINTEMANLCQLAKLEIIPHCGHNIHFENTNLFIEKIKHFLL
ncbi:2-succinyl-6-hydroxy-2,4-cyclohexadiene-1-carboxylate synthase [Pseudanabaena sp. PCC 6802]|uniref:2-succinyl-6-hydroxy-2, 4-cyclohexadiene-1-carboxylate synthase n=1 Tax=Pseudanabaena sp. PCC 6802 TaxID=118173 RepID=UPI0003462D25|nr:2-succinyl-6-hydroxy-2,4-cyclohexadiene-1-carboxylate synthase [Pseudanabaena sp. PCC 6802]